MANKKKETPGERNRRTIKEHREREAANLKKSDEITKQRRKEALTQQAERVMDRESRIRKVPENQEGEIIREGRFEEPNLQDVVREEMDKGPESQMPQEGDRGMMAGGAQPVTALDVLDVAVSVTGLGAAAMVMSNIGRRAFLRLSPEAARKLNKKGFEKYLKDLQDGKADLMEVLGRAKLPGFSTQTAKKIAREEIDAKVGRKVLMKFRTNPKSFRESNNLLTSKGMNRFSAMYLIGMLGTYPFASWAKQEVAQNIGITYFIAREAKNIEGMALALEMERMHWSTGNLKTLQFLVPYSNVANEFIGLWKSSKKLLDINEQSLRNLAEKQGWKEEEINELLNAAREEAGGGLTSGSILPNIQ